MELLKKVAVASVVAGLSVVGATSAQAEDAWNYGQVVDHANVTSYRDQGYKLGGNHVLGNGYYDYLVNPVIAVNHFKPDTATISPDVNFYVAGQANVVDPADREVILKGQDWSSPTDPDPYFKVTTNPTFVYRGYFSWNQYYLGIQCLRPGTGDSIRSVNGESGIGGYDSFSAVNVTCAGGDADSAAFVGGMSPEGSELQVVKEGSLDGNVEFKNTQLIVNNPVKADLRFNLSGPAKAKRQVAVSYPDKPANFEGTLPTTATSDEFGSLTVRFVHNENIVGDLGRVVIKDPSTGIILGAIKDVKFDPVPVS